MKLFHIMLYLLFFITLSLNICCSDNDDGEFTEEKIEADYNQMAIEGVNNLIKNFWEENEGIRPTWGGINIPDNIEDKRGQLWERAMMLYPMYQLYLYNNDAELKAKLLIEAARLKEKYESSILMQAGHHFNTAIDDCGWNAVMYMFFYDLTKDRWYIDITKGLINSVFDRWTDQEDGALYYKDGSDIKSLYTTSLVYAMLDIYEVTGEEEWLEKAMFHYNWMTSLLGRTDGLYWTDANESGPIGKEKPNNIAEGGSVSFLAGNQGMCVLAKRLYDIKKDETYLEQIKKTSLRISITYNNKGIYINDRDAWTNGFFMSDFVKMIASDPQLTYANADMILATARSIVSRNVTVDGYYGGSWQGPAGEGSKWTDGGSIPQQIMTSGSTVQVLVAAAILNNLN